MTSISGEYLLPDAQHAPHAHKYVDEHPMATAYAGARRRIAALEEQLQNIQHQENPRFSYQHLNMLNMT
jgi:hypothetical protein